MQNKQHDSEIHDDGTYVVKKSKKAGMLAFVLCLLIAFVIWAYSTATEDKENTTVGNNMTETVAE